MKQKKCNIVKIHELEKTCDQIESYDIFCKPHVPKWSFFGTSMSTHNDICACSVTGIGIVSIFNINTLQFFDAIRCQQYITGVLVYDRWVFIKTLRNVYKYRVCNNQNQCQYVDSLQYSNIEIWGLHNRRYIISISNVNNTLCYIDMHTFHIKYKYNLMNNVYNLISNICCQSMYIISKQNVYHVILSQQKNIELISNNSDSLIVGIIKHYTWYISAGSICVNTYDKCVASCPIPFSYCDILAQHMYNKRIVFLCSNSNDNIVTKTLYVFTLYDVHLSYNVYDVYDTAKQVVFVNDTTIYVSHPDAFNGVGCIKTMCV